MRDKAECIMRESIQRVMPGPAVTTALQNCKFSEGRLYLVAVGKAAWEMALSIMKGGAIFSVIVLLGYVREWFGSGRNLPEEKELLHPVRQWMKEYQESFLQLSRSFCMTPQPVEGLDRGERLLQLRLAENRMAAAGQIQEMSQILEGAMERIYGTQEDGKLEQEIGLLENNIGFFAKSKNAEALIAEVRAKIDRAREELAATIEKVKLIDRQAESDAGGQEKA